MENTKRFVYLPVQIQRLRTARKKENSNSSNTTSGSSNMDTNIANTHKDKEKITKATLTNGDNLVKYNDSLKNISKQPEQTQSSPKDALKDHNRSKDTLLIISPTNRTKDAAHHIKGTSSDAMDVDKTSLSKITKHADILRSELSIFLQSNQKSQTNEYQPHAVTVHESARSNPLSPERERVQLPEKTLKVPQATKKDGFQPFSGSTGPKPLSPERDRVQLPEKTLKLPQATKKDGFQPFSESTGSKPLSHERDRVQLPEKTLKVPQATKKDGFQPFSESTGPKPLSPERERVQLKTLKVPQAPKKDGFQPSSESTGPKPLSPERERVQLPEKTLKVPQSPKKDRVQPLSGSAGSKPLSPESQLPEKTLKVEAKPQSPKKDNTNAAKNDNVQKSDKGIIDIPKPTSDNEKINTGKSDAIKVDPPKQKFPDFIKVVDLMPAKSAGPEATNANKEKSMEVVDKTKGKVNSAEMVKGSNVEIDKQRSKAEAVGKTRNAEKAEATVGIKHKSDAKNAEKLGSSKSDDKQKYNSITEKVKSKIEPPTIRKADTILPELKGSQEIKSKPLEQKMKSDKSGRRFSDSSQKSSFEKKRRPSESSDIGNREDKKKGRIESSQSNRDEKKRRPSESSEAVYREEKRKRSEGKLPRIKDHRFLSPLASRPVINSSQIVLENLKAYHEANNTLVDFYYPSGDFETFTLLLPKLPKEEYDPIQDIYHTVRLISRYIPGLGDETQGINRQIIKFCNLKNIEKLIETIKEYNAIIKQAPKIDVTIYPAADLELIQHALEQAYSRSIGPQSHLLNNYIGFSNNVYGEIKPSFVHEVIQSAKILPTDIFLDLGSGIGNVVLQVAAECLCESYGIEIMETPSSLAKKQRTEFLTRMRMYGRPCGKIFLKQGDFLFDESILNVIKKADVIFVNKYYFLISYAFDAELCLGILSLFLDIKETCKVITLKSFAPVGRNSLRRINAIESIFSIKEVLGI